jgi:hypothetical protein
MSGATVRPIHLPGTAAMESLRELATAALEYWAKEWISAESGEPSAGLARGQPPMLALRAQPLAGQPQSYAVRYRVMRAEGGRMWFQYSDAQRAQLGRALFGAQLMVDIERADRWIVEVIDRAWAARDRAVCAALLGAQSRSPRTSDPAAGAEGTPPELVSGLPAELFAFGSGAVQVSCDWLGLHAVADSSVWRAVPPVDRDRPHRLPKPVALEPALGRATARVEAILGNVEIELAQLLELRFGDVLRLPRRLDQPIAVFCEGKPLTSAALGARQGRKCVRLAPDIDERGGIAHDYDYP